MYFSVALLGILGLLWIMRAWKEPEAIKTMSPGNNGFASPLKHVVQGQRKERWMAVVTFYCHSDILST